MGPPAPISAGLFYLVECGLRISSIFKMLSPERNHGHPKLIYIWLLETYRTWDCCRSRKLRYRSCNILIRAFPYKSKNSCHLGDQDFGIISGVAKLQLCPTSKKSKCKGNLPAENPRRKSGSRANDDSNTWISFTIRNKLRTSSSNFNSLT